MKKQLFVYIDETGDRGAGPKSSPIFGMAAVMVDAAGAAALRAAAEQLRADFAVPLGKVLSWKEYVKTHDRRKRAMEVLRKVSGVKVFYVYSVKAELDEQSYLCDQQRFYDSVAQYLCRNILWGARNSRGEQTQVHLRFGHVKDHDHDTTKSRLLAAMAEDPRVPENLIHGLRWVSSDRYAESQVADLYAGFLKAALWPTGQFGYVESMYLLGIWPQIRNSENCAVPLGIVSRPDNALLTRHDWFPCAHCPKKEKN